MTDIFIKGMEMPRIGKITLDIYPNGDVFEKRGIERIGYAKATELPPHGRLIDADEFITELRTTINKVLLGSLLHNIFVNDEAVKQDTLDGINFVLDRLENEAPTILEADNGSDN